MRIVIHSGKSWQQWSPHVDEVDENQGLGGSQLAATKIAHSIAIMNKKASVVLIGDFTKDALRKSVCLPNLVFKPLDQYEIELFKENVDLLVVSRYTEYLRSFNSIKNIVLWCHDLAPIGKLFPFTNTFFYTVLALSPWHEHYLKMNFPQNYVFQTRNGLEPSLYHDEPWQKKVQHRFIYSSAIYRGLDTVLNCWPLILQRLDRTSVV